MPFPDKLIGEPELADEILEMRTRVRDHAACSPKDLPQCLRAADEGSQRMRERQRPRGGERRSGFQVHQPLISLPAQLLG